jgi:hypothetical protein
MSQYRVAPLLAVLLLTFGGILQTSCGNNNNSEECVFAIATERLPLGVVGVSYSYDLAWEAPGCYWNDPETPVEWTFLSGDLPPGISFDIEGKLRGTPQLAGEFVFTIKVTHVTGSQTDELQKGFVITVNAADGATP